MVAELLAVIIGNSLNKVLNGCQESFNDPPYFAGAFVGSLAKQEKTTFTLCKCHQNAIGEGDNGLQSVFIIFGAFGFQDLKELALHVFVGEFREVKALASRKNGWQNFIRLG